MEHESEIERSYHWVARIIESCNQPFHIDCAKKIIEQFVGRYGECEHYHKLLNQLVAKEPILMVV